MADERVVVPIDLTVQSIKVEDISLSDVKKSVQEQLNSIAKSASDVLGQIDTSKFNKALTSSMQKLVDSYDKVNEAQRKLNDAMSQVGSTSPEYKKQFKAIQDEIKKTEDYWRGLSDQLEQNPLLRSGTDKMLKGMPISKAESDAIKMYDDALNYYESEMERLKNAIPNPNDYVATATTTEIQKVAKAYYDVFNAVNKVKNATTTWNQTVSDNKFSDSYTAKLQELAKIEQKINTIKEKSAKMSELGATGNAWASLEYDANMLKNKVQEITDELFRMVQTGAAFRFGSGDVEGEMARIAELSNKLSDNIAEVGNAPKNVKTNTVAVLSIIGKFCNSVSKKLKEIIGHFAKLRREGNKTTTSLGKSFKKLFRNVLMFGFGIRSVYFLVKRLRKVFTENFMAMAAQIPEINTQVSSFMTSINQLKGSFVTAFQPIASYVIPLLNKLIGALSSAMNAVGRFFATLTGQGYIYKFTAAQVDYAKSLKDTAKNAKDAQKALMGFDEINRLDDNKETDSGAGGGAEGTWEKSPINPSKLAQLIKNAWAKADFTDVGRYLSEALRNALLKAYNWLMGEGKVLAFKIGESLATLLNGFFENKGVGDLLGRTLAALLNNAVLAAFIFLRDTDWSAIGAWIGAAVMSAISNFNWILAGTTLGMALRAMIDTGLAFLDEIDFNEIGHKLALMLNMFLTKMGEIDETGLTGWQKLGELCRRIITGLIDTLKTFIQEADWYEIGKAIGQFLSELNFGEIIWDFATLIASFVSGLAQAFVGWTATDPLSAAIATLIGTAILGVSLAGKLLPIIAEFMKLKTAITGVGTPIKELTTIIGSVIKTISGIALIISGAIMAISSFFSIWNEGFTWAREILMLLGIALVAVGVIIVGGLTGTAAAVVAIVAGVVAFVATVVLAIKNYGTEIIEFLKGAWETIKTSLANFGISIITTLVGLWTKIKTTVSNGINSIKTTINTALTVIKTIWTTVWTTVKTTAQNIWNGIKTTISNAINNVRTIISNVMNTVKTTWTNAWNAVKTATSNVFNGIKNVIKGAVNGIIGFVNGMIRGIVNGINSAIRAINSLSFTIPSWVPGFGGNSIGFNISTVSAPQIPLLAKGAVIPPNNQFLAMLGDQKSGTNVEAPLSTIQEAVALVLDEQLDAMAVMAEAIVAAIENKNFSVKIGDKEIGQANDRYNRRQALIRGNA